MSENDDCEDDEFADDDWEGTDEECAFCIGREAAERGEPESANPFVPTGAEPGSIEWYESDFGLWDTGHGFGQGETRQT